MLDWFTDFLQKRSQIVKIENTYGDKIYLAIRLLQGRLLGPLLFNIYKNKGAKMFLREYILAFSDDTVIVYDHMHSENAV